MTAFVTSVVPWTTVPRDSADTSPACSSPVRASRTPAAGSLAVVSTFPTRNRPLSPSTSMRSVNVPPMSTPARHFLVTMRLLLDGRVAIQRKDVNLWGALPREQAAVHDKRVPRDVASVVRCEERRAGRNLLRHTHTPERNGFATFALILLGHRRGQDRARRHSVHANAVRREVECGRASECLDAALGRVVRDVAAVRLRCPAARHADDAAAFAAGHQSRNAIGAEIDAFEVHVEHAIPPCFIAVEEVA